jgi:RNA polymerase sigma factor (TIGR02999 family)
MSQSVTQLLSDWRKGDEAAFNELMLLVYDELHQLAQRYMSRERPGHTWQATALVNEAWLRLAGQDQRDWQNRAHFFGVAAQVMRHLLVDHARAQQFAKRGGAAQRVTLDENAAISHEDQVEILALDEALQRLAQLDERKSRIVELRYFGGLSVEETAEATGLSAITVKREWLKAKTWLYRELSQEGDRKSSASEDE